MTILYRLRALARWLFRRDEIEQALDSDLADYIERSAAEKMQAGMSAAEARRLARIELGGVEQTKERVRAALSLGPVEKLGADVRYALRALRRQKMFTAVAMSTLALGIGVNVAIFSLADQILLRPLPVPEPGRLVNLTDPSVEPKFAGSMDPALFPQGGDSASGGEETIFSYPMFRDLERGQESFTGLAGHRFFEAGLASGEETRRATGALVSGSYFPVLGVQPALGRLLDSRDDRVDGQAESVVLSYSYWRNGLGGDPGVLGQTLGVNEVPLTIVGVAPQGFHGTAVGARASVFVPITISFYNGPDSLVAATSVPNHDRRDSYWVHLFARLEPGVTAAAASAEIDALHRGILSDVEAPLLIDVSAEQRDAFRARPLVLEAGGGGQTSSGILAPARNGLVLLLAVSGVVLLLCCANVAGLILLRAATRTGEIAVRASMGATRGRLASLLLVESLVLALPAALLSFPVAWLTLRGAVRVPGIPEAAPDMSLSAVAALVAIGIAVASALAVGLVPVRDLIRIEPARTLQAYGARQTSARGVTRFRAALATAQVALSMALLAVTGLFAQSLANIARLDLGLDIDSVVMFELVSSGAEPGSRERIRQALDAAPGVTAVASSLRPLLSLERWTTGASVEGMQTGEMTALSNAVSPNFFRTFGIGLLAGRDFDAGDTGAFSAAIVNQRFVERLGLTPEAMIGRRIDTGMRDMATGTVTMIEVVGVVADITSGSVTGEIEPEVFQPYMGSTFYVRGTQSTEALMGTVRDTIARVEPALSVTNLQTLEQQFRENVAIQRFFAASATAFAVLATALAALGLYGVLAYSVARRSREIGLRFALGAPAGRVRGLVLRQVARMAAAGIVLGAVAAWVLGRAARSVLFGVEAGEPLVLAGAAVVLAAVTLGAAYIPARRASRVDPMTVLRYE